MLRPPAALCALILFLSLHLGSVFALAIADDFNDGNDAGWSRYSPLEPYGSPGLFSFPSGAYRIEASVSADATNLGPARAGSFRADTQSSDFDLSVDLVDLNAVPIDTDLGLFARINNVGIGDTDGYSFTYDLGGQLSLNLIKNEGDTLLASFSITLDVTHSYRLRFTGSGSLLGGTVADLASPQVILASLTAMDTTYQSGVAGFFVYDDSSFGDQNASGTFDNFVAIIPEPSTNILGAFGLVLFGLKRPAVRRSRTH